MANSYVRLFSAPGAVGFSIAGFLARIPLSMTGIGIITMLSRVHGDFALAGAVSATFTLAVALISPQVSRLVDRHGQARVAMPAAATSVISIGALLLCVRADAPVWTNFVFAVLAGCMPNMGALVRARWQALYPTSSRLHTAFSFESVVDELSFVIGPALSVALSTMLFPEAGPLTAAVLLAAGTVCFLAQRATEPPLTSSTGGTGRSVIGSPAVLILVGTLVAGGVIVGTVDVVSVAFAEAQGDASSAGLVLSVYAVGSALAGLWFGARTLPIPAPRLLITGTVGTALTTLPLLLWVDGIPSLAAAVFFAGVFFAPTMIVVMGLVERIVPASRLTEAMTWAITGLNIGVALGAASAGRVVDAHGPSGGFAVAVVAGTTAAATALVGYRLLTSATRASEDEDPATLSAEETSPEFSSRETPDGHEVSPASQDRVR
ncbi:MFS transporter [Actinoalloteichus hymeniacidonis]|uniref:Major Facilitator Superfamily transporter n=1 Tax=Actinoalloteichus hymeniacidonis TaxID=340345 RepID=A0AAC9MX75_9PSEU|nr:MFS transporter [Actinoalloteichus hymeniacidonis]AOS62938.1 Major Facilitator Superfamily transporter [Actinoalloteichus hymeniacidonis]MBB5909028.1 MFS family permease [Actinoalloteichus hymeniacidonis]